MVVHSINRQYVLSVGAAFAIFWFTLSVASSEGIRAEDRERIDAFAAKMVAADGVVGAAVMVVGADGPLHSAVFGARCSGGDPVTLDTRFQLGSMSKSFTALAVLSLVEEGRLSLDAPLSEVLPDLELSDGAARRITIEHLLHHTAGLDPRTPILGADASLQEHVAQLRGQSALAPPGQTHSYSSINYQVLGLVVERVSGVPFGDFVRERIFSPLGMDDARTAVTAADPTMACGHTYAFGFPARSDQQHEVGRLPSASLIASANDMGKYLQALLRDGQGDNGQLLPTLGTDALFPDGFDAGEFRYAKGWRVGPIGGAPARHHGGYLSDFRGKMILLEPTDARPALGVIVLTNTSSMLGRVSSHVMANGIARILSDQKIPKQGLSLLWVLRGLALVLVLLTYGLLKDALLWRKRAESLAQRWRGRSWQRISVALSMGWSLLVPPIVLFGMPTILSMTWSQLYRAMPDVIGWMWAYLPLSFAVTVWTLRSAAATPQSNRGGQSA